jgi:hypothetical protein
MTLIGSKFEIFCGRYQIFWNTVTFQKTKTIAVLTVCMTLIGSKFQKFRG